METVICPRDSSQLSVANKFPVEQRELIFCWLAAKFKTCQIKIWPPRTDADGHQRTATGTNRQVVQGEKSGAKNRVLEFARAGELHTSRL